MKQRAIMALLSLAILLTLSSCTSCIHKVRDLLHLKAKPVTFEVYEQKDEVTIPTHDGEWTEGINLSFCVPTGDGKTEQNVTKGIIEIISKAAVARALGAPQGNTLKEVADNYVKVLKSDPKAIYERLLSTEESFSTTICFKIVCTYQNEKCAVFYVVDEGLYYETNHRTEYVVRLSDGHVMTNEEIAKISAADLSELACNFLDEGQNAHIELDGEYTLSLDARGLLFHPDQHYLKEYAIPYEAVEAYLTEEGKELLTAKTFKESEAEQHVEPIKGDLALFELQGQVKKVEIREGDILNTYTFDAEGCLLTERYDIDGMIIEDKLFERTERDDQGRGAVRLRQPQVKEANTFDDLGRRKKMIYTIGGKLESVVTYYYGINGQLSVEDCSGLTTKYFNYKVDEHGNWIERQSSSSDDFITVTRTITYYE